MRSAAAASLVALAAAAATLAAEHPARACGGCFQPPAPKEVTVVTGHRMAFAITQQQSVLWDQIQYSGAPQDFAWVLPVKAGAVIQLSHDDFFAALDAVTTPTVTGPTPNCGSGSSFACGGSASGAAEAFSGGGSSSGGVQVISQGTVGPYDTVTVRSTDPNALYAWLNANSYDVPASTRPLIDAYVAEGFDFIALRLQPGEGIQAMQPVRIVTPGAGLALPLRMVAAGVGAQVGITLFVIGEGRYEAQNFPNAVIDDSQLVWLHAQSRSNYTELAQGLMAQGGNRTWLTEYAQETSLEGSNTGCNRYYGNQGTLAAAYFSQCSCGGSAVGPDGGTCGGFDDLDVAAAGMTNPATAWVTRMRAQLAPDALAAADLVLQASAAQARVFNQHTATVYDDPAYSPCGSTGGGGGGRSGCAIGDEPAALGRWLVVGSLALAGGALVRRRRSR